MECRDIQISCIAARVWQSHSRHADIRKVSNQNRPSTRKYLAGPSGAHPHGEAFISNVKSWVSRAGWWSLQKHTDLRRSRFQGAQLG
jgi:hypothetical protein